MQEVLVVGAGGLGREVFHLAQNCVGYGSSFKIVGFIDDNPTALNRYEGYPPIVGIFSELMNATGKSLFIAIGNNGARRRAAEALVSRNHSFITLVHSTARIAGSLRCGQGCLIGPLVSVGAEATLGAFVLLQTGVIVGHDVSVASYCRLDNYAVLVAKSTVGEGANVHSAAVVNGSVTIGDSATVGAASFVVRTVRAGSTVLGNPAKEL